MDIWIQTFEHGTPNLDNRLHIIGKLNRCRQLPGILTDLAGFLFSVIYEFMIFGASTNGKSGDFGSPMWWFESTRPKPELQFKLAAD